MFSPIWLTYFLSFMLSIITKKFSIDLTDSFKVSWSTLSKCVFNTLFYLLADCFYTVSVQFAPNTFDEILLCLLIVASLEGAMIYYKISYKIAGEVFAETVYMRITMGTHRLVLLRC